MSGSMRQIVLLALLIVPSRVQAQAPQREEEAVALLKRAVAAQGKLPNGGLRDLQILFEGQINEKKEGSHSIHRNYWFRQKDRSFRIETFSPLEPKDSKSERGVLGNVNARYWELIRRKRPGSKRPELKRQELSRTNKTHLENIRTIQRDRDDFERIVRMVVLSRVDSKLARLRRGAPQRVALTGDHPNSASFVFPSKLKGSQYLVLDLQRSAGDPLRLFINEKDLTVRKVVQFDRAAPNKIKFVYYLGAYRKMQGMLLPTYVSVHSEVPTKKTREKTTKLAGRLTLTLNAGLDDSVFSPPNKKP
jgi:hypothetical protein